MRKAFFDLIYMMMMVVMTGVLELVLIFDMRKAAKKIF